MQSWKTTTAGVLAIVIAVAGAAKTLLEGGPVDWTIAIAAVMAGIGLIMARDNNRSSEDVGAK